MADGEKVDQENWSEVGMVIAVVSAHLPKVVLGFCSKMGEFMSLLKSG